MSKRWIAVSCSMACMLFSAVASASDSADSLQGAVGNWTCHMQNSNDFAAISIERTSNDWYVGWAVGFKDDGSSMKKVIKVRYDQARQKYVMFAFVGDGSYGYGLTDGGIQADTNGNHTLAFKGEYYKADGTDVNFTQTFSVGAGGVSITLEPQGEQATTVTCDKYAK